jgi:hypothetical protein
MSVPASVQATDGQQLAVKNVDRIEAIQVVGEDKRCEAALYTWVFSRLMRRDFNLTSIKLFFFCKKQGQLEVARDLLQTLTEEAQVLTDMAYRYEMPVEPIFSSCVMRIITDESQQLFDALVAADRALHKMQHSSMAEVAEDNLVPFMRAYNALRKKVIGFPKRSRSSDQAANEQE